jgi:hypothetical protein
MEALPIRIGSPLEIERGTDPAAGENNLSGIGILSNPLPVEQAVPILRIETLSCPRAFGGHPALLIPAWHTRERRISILHDVSAPIGGSSKGGGNGLEEGLIHTLIPRILAIPEDFFERKHAIIFLTLKCSREQLTFFVRT